MASDGYKTQDEINQAVGERLFNESKSVYDPAEYSYEKVIGRRRHDGVTKLKKLSARHKNVIALHLRGLSNRDISFITGLSEVYVGQMLHDPLCQEVISIYIAGIDQEMEALAPMAVDAVRAGLSSDSIKTRLMAADRFFKATGRFNEGDKKGDSAEDVMARALAAIAVENNLQLRDLNRRQSTTPIPKTIDASPTRQILTLPNYSDEEEGTGTDG